jgi:hypothetical protein
MYTLPVTSCTRSISVDIANAAPFVESDEARYI